MYSRDLIDQFWKFKHLSKLILVRWLATKWKVQNEERKMKGIKWREKNESATKWDGMTKYAFDVYVILALR